ncbi:MAG: PAS domain-containing sensor histidine kinase [Anaerolineae bacterium]|nr:PAS domain-containing sensor histidine kinase [Anaerolineae bacterium]
MSDNTMLTTWFAPAERAPEAELAQQAHYFAEWNSLRAILDAVPDAVMVLNRHRQLVYCNEALLTLLQVEDRSSLIGLRPGEVLHCIHSTETAGGCGTTEFCRACGATRAIVDSQQGERTVGECCILMQGEDAVDALDLRVWATPLDYRDEPFTIFTMVDIRDEKRRAALEQVFFHDVLNLVGALQGAMHLMALRFSECDMMSLDRVRNIARYLAEEIKAQRDLMSAENNQYVIEPEVIKSVSLLQELCMTYRQHYVAVGREIHLAPDVVDVELVTDVNLIRRVISNMLKNALEAVSVGEVVTMGCQMVGERVQFWVHNPGYIPREVQLQLFQRSFSTKGARRGLGTYSMRLLSERYLQGAVTFSSSSELGTRFEATYPLQLQ